MSENENNKKGFIFYRSFYEAIKHLPDDEQLKMYQAITEYSLNSILIDDLEGISKSLFTLIKPQLDANHQKYINSTSPKKANKKQEESKQEAGRKQMKRKQKQTISKPVTKEKEKEKDNKNKNKNKLKENLTKENIWNLLSIKWKNDNQEFKELFEDFIIQRKDMGHPLSENAVKRFNEKFKRWGLSNSIENLSLAIENDYRGIFESSNNSKQTNNSIRYKNNDNEIDYPNGIEIND